MQCNSTVPTTVLTLPGCRMPTMKTPPPDPPPASQLLNTPIRPRNSNARLSDGGNLNTRRDRILNDLGPIQEYCVDTMLDCCCPQLTGYVLPSNEQLKMAKLIDDNSRWRLFPDDLVNSILTENVYFSKLGELCHAICKLPLFLSSSHGGRTMSKPSLSEMNPAPNRVPLSARKYYHCPDFYFTLKDKRSLHLGLPANKESWYDIFCSGEVKKGMTKADMYDVSIDYCFFLSADDTAITI